MTVNSCLFVALSEKVVLLFQSFGYNQIMSRLSTRADLSAVWRLALTKRIASI